MACNNPIPGFEFMSKYFPDKPGPAECDNNVCTCPASGSSPSWEIQQGRVNLDLASGGVAGPPGGATGFGIHLVNVSEHLTTGGMSVAEVEAEFAKKLGDMTTFDSFMDYGVTFITSDLDGYVKAFDADSVPYLSYEADGGVGIFVNVPESAMIIELTASNSSVLAARGDDHVFSEPRASPKQKLRAELASTSGVGVGSTLSLASVNRAVSKATLDKLDAFYVDGMGCTLDSHVSKDGVERKCYLWRGAGDDVCFTARADNATKTDFKVGDFETMLNKVHDALLTNPLCALDKWTDVHYAVDLHDTMDQVVDYIKKENPKHFCFSESSLHYLVDPTGMSIQLDMQFSDAASVCGGSDVSSFRRRLQPPGPGGGNPACNPGTCS